MPLHAPMLDAVRAVVHGDAQVAPPGRATQPIDGMVADPFRCGPDGGLVTSFHTGSPEGCLRGMLAAVRAHGAPSEGRPAKAFDTVDAGASLDDLLASDDSILYGEDVDECLSHRYFTD